MYARAELARAEPGLLQRALDRVLEAVAGVFDAATATGAGRVIGIVVLTTVVLVLAWLVARGLSRVRRDRAQPVEIEGPAGRPGSDWLVEAGAHTRAGAHREALRCHYRAALAWLAERGLVEEVPGTTTGEYRRTVTESAPGAERAFGALTEAFERAWYGQVRVTITDVEQAAKAASSVRASVPGRTVTTR